MKNRILKTLFTSILFFSLCCCQKEDVIVQSLFDLTGAPLTYDDSKATKFINVAAVCISPSKIKAGNVRMIRQKSLETKDKYPITELILFPETILGWYIDDSAPEEYQRNIAEPIPGETTRAVSLLADSLNVYIVFGMAEAENGKIYNSQVIIDPDGAIAGVHRKINLTPEDEKSGYTPGDRTPDNVTIVSINQIKVGLIICADVSSYWLTKQLTGKGVEVILHSMASEATEFNIDPVARQFNAWEVFCNRWSHEGKRSYSGTTYIADPSGTIRVSDSGKESIQTYKIGVR